MQHTNTSSLTLQKILYDMIGLKKARSTKSKLPVGPIRRDKAGVPAEIKKNMVRQGI
jgi:hypothetical protein